MKQSQYIASATGLEILAHIGRNKMFRRFALKLLWVCFLFVPFSTRAQVKVTGIPNIQNYPKSVYDAGTQNWAIAQGKKGFVYFANNDGLLRFDGIHWDLLPVSKSSPVRSVFIGKNDSIYIGLLNDFGVLEPTPSGKSRFRSLRSLLPAGVQDFDDVWKISEIQGTVFFQSYDYLFVYKNGQIQVIHPQNRFQFSFLVNERLILYEPDSGLYEYRNGKLDKLPWSGSLQGTEIREILEIQPNQLLIATTRDGIYKADNGRLEKWNVPVNRFAEEFSVFSAAKIEGNFYAFGTISNGLVISDSDGEIVQHLNRNRGLQNNTVLSIFTDRDGNIWLGLDNGIDYVEINSPLTYVSDFDGLGAGYCAQVYDEKLYLGTNQGLYVKPFDSFSKNTGSFELVENTTGQVWSLEVFDGQLFCGHNQGTFQIQGKKAVQISNEPGGWTYIKLNNRDDLLLGGHYNGLQLFSKTDNNWLHSKTLKGFNESSRFLFQDTDGTVWMSHGGKGVFSIQLNQESDSVTGYTLFDADSGLPSNEQNILFGYNGQACISAVDGIYRFNREVNAFEPDTNFMETFQVNGRLKTFKQDSNGNYWFVSGNESGVFRLNEDLTFTKITAPFTPLKNKFINEFEFIYPFNNDHVFIGIDNGFAHYSNKFLKSYARPYSSYISKVEIPYLDSTLYLLNGYIREPYSFPYKKNAFRFHFSAPFFEGSSHLQFSYFLENYHENWSDWNLETYLDFTNLPEGKYIFHLKARNIYGEESETATFQFRVTPPWYRSNLAYFAYFLIFLLTLFLVLLFASKRMETAKRKEIEKHQEALKEKEQLFRQQALLAEKENIKLRNEKLTAEMLHRNKDLANQTMNIIQKNEFLVKIKEELQRLQKSTSEGTVKTKLSAMARRINKELDNEQQNQIFETYFDEVHSKFFKRLRSKYPDLTAREMKLSAYIRMNLSTKEIAVLLNISDRGVEIARYRLRKKLNLERETNLATFLLNV